MFQYLSSQPLKAQQFTEAMKFYTNLVPGNSESFLVHGYDWNTLRPGATVVDIGGSDGHVSISLARAYPNLRFIVQDTREVAEAAAVKAPVEIGGDRLRFEPYDFFTPQTVSADAYLVRWVFHDWPDGYIVAILQQLIPALKIGARIIVNESICPEPGSLPISTERTVR